MNTTHNNIEISERTDLEALRDHFQDKGMIQIPQFLGDDSAAEIHSYLAKQQDWNLCWNKGGEHVDMNYQQIESWEQEQKDQLTQIVHDLAEQQFQYLYGAIPIYDLCANNKVPKQHMFHAIYDFFNCSEFLQLARLVTGFENIEFADVQATKYSGGHFLNEHDDGLLDKNRLAAFVLNLTPIWQRDWGGSLVLCEPDGQVLFPSFNQLNLFSVPRKHFVSFVPPYVKESRYALTGWLRFH